MASKLPVLIVGFLVLSLVMLVTSTGIYQYHLEAEASCVHIGVPCNTNDDCIGPCERNGN
ncbi:unnamed protein product, partial [Musa hybrid cultivar]